MKAAQDQLRGAEDQVLRLQGQEKQFEIQLNAIVEAETSAQRERDALNARQTSDRERYAAQQAKIQVLHPAACRRPGRRWHSWKAVRRKRRKRTPPSPDR